MLVLLLVIHVLITIALVGVILMQKSEGGALGIGGGGGMANFMSGRGTANVLTRTTAILAACFMVTSLALIIIPEIGGKAPSILPESVPTEQLPAVPAPALPKPATPTTPTVPLGQ